MNLHFFTPAYSHYLSIMAGRAFFMFLYLIVLFRLLGKRQIGQINIFDLAAIMGVANAVQNGITMGSGNLSVGINAALILLLTCRAVAALLVRFPILESRVIGSPTVLVSNGKAITANMNHEMITRDQLLAVMRSHGLQDVKDVRVAVLEVDGTISIVPRKQ